MQEISKEQAKRILCRHTAIYSNHSGKKGMNTILKSLGSIQLDTLPIVGRNHDLICQARMKDYEVDQFLEFSHGEGWGFEHYDKSLAMIAMDYFPLTYAWMKMGGDGYYQRREKNLRKKHPQAFNEVLELLRKNEFISSKEIEEDSEAGIGYIGWKAGKVGVAILDCYWNRGEAFIHHRESYRRFYSLPEKRIAQKYLDAEKPETEEELSRQLLLRRTNQIGLASKLWQPRHSGKYVNELKKTGDIIEVKIAGGRQTYLTTDEILDRIDDADELFDERVRFLAPLDPLIWDRKMTLDIFGFDYVWEVYKPVKDRVWGYYLLPVFYQNEFLGRMDVQLNRKENILQIKNGYWETNFKPSSSLIENMADELGCFCNYLGTDQVECTTKDKSWRMVCEQSGMSIR